MPLPRRGATLTLAAPWHSNAPEMFLKSQSFRLTRARSSRWRARALVIHLTRDAGQMNGAACVTRTRDPVITNGKMYCFYNTLQSLEFCRVTFVSGWRS